MNIALSEVQSLSFNMPESAPEAGSDGSEFHLLLQDSYGVSSEETGQVIENISLLTGNENFAGDLVDAGILPLAWLEHLASSEVIVTTEAGKPAGLPVDNAPAPIASQLLPPLAGVGELLPTSGNALPSGPVLPASIESLSTSAISQQLGGQKQAEVISVASQDDGQGLKKMASMPGLDVSTQSQESGSNKEGGYTKAFDAGLTQQSIVDLLLQDSYGVSSEETGQVIENISLLTGNENFAGDLVDAGILPLAWLEHLASSEVIVTTEAGKPAGLPVDNAPAPIASQLLPPLAGVGELLPTSGNALPSGPVLPASIESLSTSAISQQLGGQKQAEVISVASQDDGQGLKKMASMPGLDVSTQSQESGSNKEGGYTKAFDAGLTQQSIVDMSGNNRLNPVAPGTMLNINPASPASPDVLARMSISMPDSAHQWSNGIGDRVSWMINQKLNSATIRLDPPALGRMDIHIQITDDITQVTINTQHAQTRDLIDNASFRLKEFLQEAGYENVNVDVSHQQGQSQANEQARAGSMDESRDEDASTDLHETGFRSGQGRDHSSLIDYFA